MVKTQVITTASRAKAVATHLLSTCPVLGALCKHGQNDEVSAVLFCNERGELYVFDTKTDKDVMYEGGVARILQSSDVLKVMHDCASSAAALEKIHKVFLRNVFDTQVAYAVILESEDLPVRRVNLQSLCQRTEVPRPSCKISRKFQMLQQDPGVWSRRPLTSEMVEAMAMDAMPLFPHLYNKLLKAIHPVYMSWFTKMNLEHVQSAKTPEMIRRKRLARVTQERLDTSRERPLDKLTLRQRILLADSTPMTRELLPHLLHRSQHLLQSRPDSSSTQQRKTDWEASGRNVESNVDGRPSPQKIFEDGAQGKATAVTALLQSPEETIEQRDDAAAMGSPESCEDVILSPENSDVLGSLSDQSHSAQNAIATAAPEQTLL